MAKLPPEINMSTSNEDADDSVPPHIFRQVVEQAALAISITDEQSNILYANPAFGRNTGYSRLEILGQNQSLLSFHRLLFISRRDCCRYLSDLSVSPLFNEVGNPTHFLGMHRDVTEVHRLE